LFGLTPRRRAKEAGRPLTRREPTPLALLRREFASLFDCTFSGWPVPFESAWELMEPWGLEVEDKGQEVVVRAELPCFKASEFGAQLTGNLLTVWAEHAEKAGAEAPQAVERRYGRLERTLTLPEGIEPDKAEARYRDGVLEVRLPKSPEAQLRRIDVKT
jgi:HSP20 family protein